MTPLALRPARLALALAALVAAAPAGAEQLCDGGPAVTVHVASYHTAPGYNDATPGVGLQCGPVAAGVYRNSFRRTSAYGAYLWETTGALRAGALVGAATGYEKSPLRLLAGIYAAADVAGVTVRLMAAPTFEKPGAVFHMTLTKGMR